MSRPLAPAAASHALHGVQIVFSETMEGYVSAAAATFEDGCKDGEAARQTLALHITVTIEDLASFLQQPGPDDYMAHAADIAPPILLMQGQDNKVFADSNIRCHAEMEKIVPGRHTLRVFPGYGHQDVFMGKNAADDIFPHVVSFLREHSHD